jgi:hypothetical protein
LKKNRKDYWVKEKVGEDERGSSGEGKGEGRGGGGAKIGRKEWRERRVNRIRQVILLLL